VNMTRTLILAFDRDYISGTWRRISFGVAEEITSDVFKVAAKNKHVRYNGDCALVDRGNVSEYFLHLM